METEMMVVETIENHTEILITDNIGEQMHRDSNDMEIVAGVGDVRLESDSDDHGTARLSWDIEEAGPGLHIRDLEQDVEGEGVEQFQQVQPEIQQLQEQIVHQEQPEIQPEHNEHNEVPEPQPDASYNIIDEYSFEELSEISLETVIYVPQECVIKYGKVVTFILQLYKNAVTLQDKKVAIKWYFAIPQLFLSKYRNGSLSSRRISNQIINRLDNFLRGDYVEVLRLWTNRVRKEKQFREGLIKLLRKHTNNTTNRAEKRMLRLIKKGDMRRGIAAGMGFGTADSSSAEVRAQVLQRHPQNSEEIGLWEQINQDENLQLDIKLDLDVIRNILAKQDMNTAPGIRGMRPHHIKCLAISDSPVCQEAFTGIVNLGEDFINMRLHKDYRTWLSAGLLIPLNKSAVGNDQRPIKMEDFDIQMWYKHEAKTLKEEVANICLPEQLGIGVSAGVETMVLGRQLEMELAKAYQINKTIAKFDIYNAFQEYSRTYLLNYMKTLIENDSNNLVIKRLHKVIYSLSEINAPIYMNGVNGLEKICECRNGGSQGNAMSPTLFALVFNSVVKVLSAEFPDVSIKAIHDDMTVVGSAEVIFGDFWNRMSDLLVPTKLTAQPTKTEAYTTATAELEHIPEWVKTSFVEWVNNEGETQRSYGLKICQIPMGDAEFVTAVLADKQKSIINQIDYVTKTVAKEDKLLALTTLYHSSQNLPEYFLRCLPFQVTRDFANDIDAKLVDMYSYATGVDILGDGYNDEWFKVRVGLRPSYGGLGIRYLCDRPSYISSFNTVFTNLSQNHLLWPEMNQIIGNMEEPGARWQQAFWEGDDTTIIRGIRLAWNDLRRRKDQLIQNIRELKQSWEIEGDKLKVLEEDDINMAFNINKIGKPINNAIQYLLLEFLSVTAESMSKGDMRAASFSAANNSALAQSLIQFRCLSKIKITDSEMAECFANYLGLPSPVSRGYEGMQIARSAHGDRFVDRFGAQLKATVGCIGGGQVTAFHDSINSWIVSHLKQLGISVRGGPGDTCKDLFVNFIGRLDGVDEEQERLRERRVQGIIPDLVIDAGSVVAVDSVLDIYTTLFDIKTMAPATTYMDVSYGKKALHAVNNRAVMVNKNYHSRAKLLDKTYNGTVNQDRGPVETELHRYGKEGIVKGLVFGPFGECSEAVDEVIDFLASHRARLSTSGNNLDQHGIKSMVKNKLVHELGLLIHRGWARVVIERARNIVIRPRVVVAHNEDNSDGSADEEYQVASIVQQHWMDHTNW
jgi:hypothetical protein